MLCTTSTGILRSEIAKLAWNYATLIVQIFNYYSTELTILFFSVLLWSSYRFLFCNCMHLFRLTDSISSTTMHLMFSRAYGKFWDESQSVCPLIELNIWVCRSLFIVRLIQSLLVLLFNLCIAEATLSICRTHTIGKYSVFSAHILV